MLATCVSVHCKSYRAIFYFFFLQILQVILFASLVRGKRHWWRAYILRDFSHLNWINEVWEICGFDINDDTTRMAEEGYYNFLDSPLEWHATK